MSHFAFLIPERRCVGRTGDTSSLNTQSPFMRLRQHLGKIRHANALRRHLEDAGIDPETCRSFKSHRPCRDVMAALEKALADALKFDVNLIPQGPEGVFTSGQADQIIRMLDGIEKHATA